MLDIIDRPTIDSLLEWEETPCVSLLMPTERAGRETRQGPIRFGNLLGRALDLLTDSGLRGPDAADLLSDASALEEDHDFWQHQEDGLIVHVAPGMTRMTRVATSLPELVVVGDAFHVKPLFQEVEGDDRFHVLAVSRNRVRLLWGRRHRVGEVEIEGSIPDGLAEALWFEDREKQLQHRASDRAGRGSVVATFHGHGSPDEADEERDRAFLRAVDRGVLELIATDTPLVLAGVTELTAMYRDLTGHPLVADDAVGGNPDDATMDELHQRAWSIVEPITTRRRRDDGERFRELPDRAAVDLDGVLSAAREGRVEAVWVPLGTQVWGDADSDEAAEHSDPMPGDLDLLDVAAARTWATSGRVHVTSEPDEVPGDGVVAALLRY